MSTPAASRQHQIHAPESHHPVAKRVTDAGRTVTDRFVACKVGGMLFLKLAGFIQDERAEILSVSEYHITLRLGQPWYRRWWSGVERRRPIEVHVQFAEPGEDLATWQTASARRSVVETRIRPLSATFRTSDFQRRAEAIRKMLRLHFVAD